MSDWKIDKFNIDEETEKQLAKTFLDAILKFFQGEENLKSFQKWEKIHGTERDQYEKQILDS